MPTIKTIQDAPTLCDFLRQVQQEEQSLRRFEVSAYDLKSYPDGTMRVKAKNLNGRFPVSDKALPSMARVAKIHGKFFGECDSRLRSFLFNYLLRQKVPGEKPLSIVLRGQEVDKIQNCNLLFAQRAPILNTISNATPKNVRKEDLKVIEYAWNGEFDISIIAPTLRREPRKNDVVAFGVNVSQGHDGAVQVQGAVLALACSNGAINRICDSRRHRIRRPINRPDREQDFLSRISLFAEEAWNQWSHHADELVQLNKILMDQDWSAALRSRLRQAPFFLSLTVVNQVLERLQIEIARHGGPLTLYDLWSAMTFLGTHRRQLSHTYRRRLRVGASEFTRHIPRVCSVCRQLLLS